MGKRSSLIHLLLRAALLLTSCVAVLAIAEIAMRLWAPQGVGPIQFAYDPELGSIPVPNQRGHRTQPRVYDYHYSHNSLGLRSAREYPADKSGRYRILVLGDSFTYGIGVNDSETFSSRLEVELARRRPGTGVDVINAGNGGKGTDYELKFFQRVGRALHPDVTVVCFFSNDYTDNEAGEYYRIAQDGGLTARPLSNSISEEKRILDRIAVYDWLISWSHVANAVKQAALRAIDAGAIPSARRMVIHDLQDAQGNFSNAANIPPTRVYLEQLARAVSSARSDLRIVYLPRRDEVESYRRNRGVSRDEEQFNGIMRSTGLAAHSLTPVLADGTDPVSTLYLGDGHFTAAAHARVAGFLTALLSE